MRFLGVTTSYIDHSGPRLRCILLRTRIEPTPPSPPVVQCSVSSAVFFRPASAQDHPPTRASPVSFLPYQESPATLSYLTCHRQSPTLPLLPSPRHACHIPVAAAPTLLPKYLLAWSSAAVFQSSDATTAHATSPLSFIPYHLHRPRILAVGPPISLPSPA